MSSLAFARLRVPWATLLLAAVIAAIAAAGDRSLGFGVEFVARSIAVKGLTASEPERLFASTLVHSSLSHLYWNLAGLLVLGWLIESALGHAVLLNVALWGGVFAMLAGLLALEPMQTLAGASGMLFALSGALLTWRALHPAAFGPRQQSGLLWVFFLLWTAAALASNEPVAGQAHLGGFVYGVGWGMLGPRFPIPWRRFFAALAVGLCLASEATLVVRAVRREPAEITRAMRVLYENPRPPQELNMLTWYWATQPDAPRTVLEMGRDAMTSVVAKVPTPAREDTLATVLYRLGDLDRAVELERALLERDTALERLPFYVSQLARFEYERFSHEADASLGSAPLRLRRTNEGAWQLEPHGAALPRRALVLNGERLVGYLELAADAGGRPRRIPALPEAGGPVVAALAVVALPADAGAPERSTRLFWMDPEVLRLP